MKILFFSRRFYPLIGGVEKHVLNLSLNLIDKGHEVTVVTEDFRDLTSLLKNWSDQDKQKIQQIKIIRIEAGKENWFKKFRVWQGLLKHYEVMRSADIIHCHDIFYWYLPFRFIFPLKKVFVTFHGYEGNNIPTKKAIISHKIAEVLSKGNICVGDFLKKWYGTKPTFVIYGAIDGKLLKSVESINLQNTILFFGRLEKDTGITSYIKVMNQLNDFRLDIFGMGKLKNTLLNTINQNKINAKIYDSINNIDETIKSYKYVFISSYLGILEAMANKRPVFAIYDSELKKDYLEMAPFANYISISKSEKEVTEAVRNYINGKSNIDVEKAYKWVSDKTWENLTDLYLRLWNKK